MKKRKMNLLLGLIALSLVLGGCGTQMYTLTEDEENLIVQYAAHMVAKHNIRQTDGMTDALPSTETEEEEDTTQTPETENTQQDNNQSGGQENNQKPTSKGIPMAEALGYEGLTVRYLGSEQVASYQEGNAYSVDAAQGKVFYIMNFELSNTTAEAIRVDNVSLNPTFKLVGADLSVKAEITVLSADFSTFKGEVQSGETIKTVLLFEVSEAKAEAAAKAELKVVVEEETKSIEL